MKKWFLLVALAMVPCFGQAGSPVVEAKPHPQIIKLNYAYAPGIAVLLQNHKTGVRGQALLYSQIDPWAGSLMGGNVNQNNGLGGFNQFGNNNQFGNRNQPNIGMGSQTQSWGSTFFGRPQGGF